MAGFKNFIMRGNLVELAVAVLTEALTFLISALVVYYAMVLPVSRLLSCSNGTRPRLPGTAPSAR
jgi:large-conductance mechanosensitive channel